MKALIKIALLSLMLMLCGVFTLRANAVGSAGCGLGSIVFSGNSWWKQLLAVTTNGTFFSQTFGITSGTSNCAPGLFGDAQKQENYIVTNLTSIQREAAQGRGEELNGLATMLGCEQISFDDFGVYTQEKYSSIFNTNDTHQILINLKVEMQKNNNLSNSCKYIGI